jgi:phosphoribosylaminoimidazolecarboxamide formyltransferase/IMP cyclohydrolase
MKRAALLSVSDKIDLSLIGRVLQNHGFTLLSTSGTLEALRSAGLEVVSIAEYTGQPEILDGRVKTLHPKIHAGLLARRDDPAHMAELEKNEILPIDIAVVNLYPFSEILARKGGNAPLAEMVEMIDIGGPTMIRAAAKNITGVAAIIDPADYPAVIKELASPEGISAHLRLKLAEKVFRVLSHYNCEIATYLGGQEGTGTSAGLILRKEEDLRYGENPHQSGVFYRFEGDKIASWKQLSGKTLSYNNYLDLDASLRLARSFDKSRSVVALIKHCNPCGVAVGANVEDALARAQACDPRSHFGGIVASNTEITVGAAQKMVDSFYEIIVAPSFEPAAFELLQTKKHLRVVQFYPEYFPKYEYRSVEGGLLKQEVDAAETALGVELLASSPVPTPGQLRELEFAWACVRHVRSNAIVIVKDNQLIGVGAGQMSRVDAAELAIRRAHFHGHYTKGAVAASDAFFPFPDGVEILADAGVVAVVAPGGAKRDEEICEIATRKGVALLFALSRHFRH